jgi:Pyridoxamine 5'-phosphate oxidase
MSVPVPLLRLRAAIEERGVSAYLLTVSEDASPHAVHVPLRWDGDVIVADVGKRSAANAAARPSVSLLFPVRADGDYSLIVDGTAAVAASDGGQHVRVTPTRAVLHRPAVVADPSAPCTADCVPLLPATSKAP